MASETHTHTPVNESINLPKQSFNGEHDDDWQSSRTRERKSGVRMSIGLFEMSSG